MPRHYLELELELPTELTDTELNRILETAAQGAITGLRAEGITTGKVRGRLKPAERAEAGEVKAGGYPIPTANPLDTMRRSLGLFFPPADLPGGFTALQPTPEGTIAWATYNADRQRVAYGTAPDIPHALEAAGSPVLGGGNLDAWKSAYAALREAGA